MAKRTIIARMEKMGYYYDDLDSHSTWVVFNYDFGRLSFDNWKDAAAWVKEMAG